MAQQDRAKTCEGWTGKIFAYQCAHALKTLRVKLFNATYNVVVTVLSHFTYYPFRF